MLVPLFAHDPAFAHIDPKTPIYYEKNKFDVVVRGVVKDQDGRPLEGATITEKGTNNSVASGNNGNFSITVKEGATLVISYIGFEVQEIAAAANTEMNITLTLLDRATSEVVVTALGIRKEKAKSPMLHRR